MRVHDIDVCFRLSLFTICSYCTCAQYMALSLDAQGESELEQVEQEFIENLPKNGGETRPITILLSRVFSPTFIKSFTLCFLAEWGDRSQIVTIG